MSWFREMKRDFITHVRDERKEEYLVIRMTNPCFRLNKNRLCSKIEKIRKDQESSK